MYLCLFFDFKLNTLDISGHLVGNYPGGQTPHSASVTAAFTLDADRIHFLSFFIRSSLLPNVLILICITSDLHFLELNQQALHKLHCIHAISALTGFVLS